MTYKIPPPPEGRFGKWAYQLWDYVARNRENAAVGFVAGTAITVGTGTAGTYTLAHKTSGVAIGTYGGTSVSAIITVDALGHILTATSGTIAAGITAAQVAVRVAIRL